MMLFRQIKKYPDMKNLSFWATIGIISVVTLFLAACGGQTDRTAANIRPAESSGPVFQAGHPEYATEIVRKDIMVETCDGTEEPRWTWAPGEKRSFMTLGRKVSVREQFGLKPGEGLAVVDSVLLKSEAKTDRRSHREFGPPTVKQPVTLPDNGGTGSSEDWDFGWVWNILRFLLGLLLIAAVILIGWQILRWIAGWPTRTHSRTDETHVIESKASEGGHPEQEPATLVVHNHERQGPETRVQFKDEGEHAMEFTVEGAFHLPLKVEVRKGKADPTTVVFGRPNQQPES